MFPVYADSHVVSLYDSVALCQVNWHTRWHRLCKQLIMFNIQVSHLELQTNAYLSRQELKPISKCNQYNNMLLFHMIYLLYTVHI